MALSPLREERRSILASLPLRRLVFGDAYYLVIVACLAARRLRQEGPPGPPPGVPNTYPQNYPAQ